MGELVLLSIPLAMCSPAFRGRSLDGMEVAFVIGLSAISVIEMEVFYWFFFLPAVVRPLQRWSNRSVEVDQGVDERA